MSTMESTEPATPEAGGSEAAPGGGPGRLGSGTAVDQEPSATAGALPAPEPAPAATPGRGRRLGWLAGSLAAAWVVPGALTLARLGWLLPPLLIVAVATILRVGRGVVDRLMISVFVVAGGVVTCGLLFSMWPWGLEPFWVAGTLFTIVVAVAWVSGRRPSIPRRFALSDLVVVGTGVFTMIAAARPLLRLAGADRFDVSATAEDRAAHFAIFDTVHRLGSYPFLDQVAARVPMRTPAESTYPPGSHLLHAVIDVFARSTTDPGPAVESFHRYFLLVLASFAFTLMTMVWAARWLIAPVIGGWRLIAATSVVAAIAVGGPLAYLVAAGFDSQIIGLAFLVMTVALAARPPRGLPERLLTLGTGIILVTYVYDFYLPAALIAAAASLVVEWRRMLPRWRPILATSVVVGAISALPLYFFLASSLSVQTQSIANGHAIPISDSALVAAVLGALIPLVTPAGRRLRSARVGALTVATMGLMVVTFAAYQVAKLGHTSYYFNKLVVCLFVVAVVCCAPLATLLRPMTASGPARAGEPRRERRGLREIALGGGAAALALTAIAGFGAFPRISPSTTGRWGESSLGVWYKGDRDDPLSEAANRQLRDLSERGLLGDGTPTLFLVADDGYVNWRVTFYNGVMNRTNGTIKDQTDRLLKMPFGASRVDQAGLGQATTAVLDTLSLPRRQPIRLVVRDRAIAEAVAKAIADRPETRATVLSLS